MPWRRFLAIDLVAAALWATYMSLLGYFGGKAFEESLWEAAPGSRLVAAAGPPSVLSSFAVRASPSAPGPGRPPATLLSAAPWRSGYAAACKAVYTGSIPVGASIVSRATEKGPERGPLFPKDVPPVQIESLARRSSSLVKLGVAVGDCR
jgi:hypothetical protein